MRWFSRIALVVAVAAIGASCGQDEVEFPDNTTAGGECGAWYPGGGGDADAGVDGGADATQYAVEEGSIFPCVVWESAMLAGEETFINLGQVYLEAEHGVTDYKSIVIVIGAENCPSCSDLIHAMAVPAQISNFEAAGALMIGMARRNLQGAPEDPDFDLEHACSLEGVMNDEGWPMESWRCINDEEDYIPVSFDTAPPWLIVVSVSDMVVRVASNVAYQPNEGGVAALLEYLNGPDFQ